MAAGSPATNHRNRRLVARWYDADDEGPAQARFVCLGRLRARATWRGAGGLAADAARRKRLPPIVHEGRRWHQRTHFTHSPSPVTRQPASSIMHFGRACKLDSRFGLGRPQPPLQQLPSRTLLSLRCCQSHVLTGPSQGKNDGSCTPCTRTAAFHARKCCRPRNPCICSSPFHARNASSPCPARPAPSPHRPPALHPAASWRTGRHRRVSVSWAESARGRLGGEQGAWRRMQRGASTCPNRP